jgi:hypothetical protein
MITLFCYDPAVLKEMEFLKTPGDPPIHPMLSIIHENIQQAACHFYELQPLIQLLGCGMVQDAENLHFSFPPYATNLLMTLIGTFYVTGIPIEAHHEVVEKVVYSTIRWIK